MKNLNAHGVDVYTMQTENQRGIIARIAAHEWTEATKNEKKIAALASCVLIAGMFVGCTQAERASYNLSKEADNFNDIRRLTVINCLQGDVLFQMQGRMSITADVEDNQLEVIVENGEDDYRRWTQWQRMNRRDLSCIWILMT